MEKCCARTHADPWHPTQCTREAVVMLHDQPFCRQHDPEEIIKRRKEKSAKHEAEWVVKKEEQKLRNVQQEVLEGFMFEELWKNKALIRSAIKDALASKGTGA